VAIVDAGKGAGVERVGIITEGMRQECDPSIRVTTVSPGVVESELASTITDSGAADAMSTYRADAIAPDAIARGALVARDAGPVEVSCSFSNQLVPGAPAASLEQLRCGSAPATELRGIADGLVNGVLYNVAAATVDTFGNVGALSLPACGAPQAKPAEEQRVQACSAAGTSPMRSGSALAFVALLGSALVRRRRHCGCQHPPLLQL